MRDGNTKIKTSRQICIRVSFLLRRRVVDFPRTMETISPAWVEKDSRRRPLSPGRI